MYRFQRKVSGTVSSPEHVQQMMEELNEMREMFQHTLGQVQEHVSSESISIENYTLINNILLNMKNDIMNLSMLSGK